MKKKIGKTKQLPFHPAWGYCTPEQVEKLQTLPDGYEYQYLKKQVAQQNKDKGIVSA